MSVNDRMTNERYVEWERYFKNKSLPTIKLSPKNKNHVKYILHRAQDTFSNAPSISITYQVLGKSRTKNKFNLSNVQEAHTALILFEENERQKGLPKPFVRNIDEYIYFSVVRHRK